MEAESKDGNEEPPVRVAVNGLGKIGRTTLKDLVRDPGVRVVAVNDLVDREAVADMIRFDSDLGHFDGKVEINGDRLVIDGVEIPFFQQKDPDKLPWGQLEVEAAIESTGRFTDGEQAGRHLVAGAQRVIVSAPGEGLDGSYVLGVNHGDFDPAKHKKISNTSCTTNGLAPAAKVLDDLYGVDVLIGDTIHAYTADQALIDTPRGGAKMRRGRSAATSTIPTDTGAMRAIKKVLPGIRVSIGDSFRVPVPDGSALSITAFLKNPPHGSPEEAAEHIRAAFERAARGPLKGILRLAREPMTSARVINDTHSAVVDAEYVRVHDNIARVLVWYDNVAAYSKRLAEMARGVRKPGFGRFNGSENLPPEDLGG